MMSKLEEEQIFDFFEDYPEIAAEIAACDNLKESFEVYYKYSSDKYYQEYPLDFGYRFEDTFGRITTKEMLDSAYFWCDAKLDLDDLDEDLYIIKDYECSCKKSNPDPRFARWEEEYTFKL